MLPASHAHEKKAGLAYWANRVAEECDKASQDFAADPVHDLRVAIRRCRSMADGFLSVDPDPQWKEMKRLAKPLFASLGELRDTQVMSEWVAKLSESDDEVRRTLLDALGQKEAALKGAAQQSLGSFDRRRWASLNAHLARRTSRVPLEGLVFQHLALERWMEAYALHRRAMRNRSPGAYHQLRIGIKRFRYTVENFLPQRHASWSRDLRDLQDALGEVHDFDVLRTLIRTHAGLPAEQRVRWRQRILDERQQRLDFYRGKMLGKNSLWQVWRSELPSGALLEEAALEKLRSWASYLDPDVAHSALVRQIALQLYDGLSQNSVLECKSRDRRILEAAAILHEVGRSGGAKAHQKRTYRMIRKLKPPLGWTYEDLCGTALVARYHRGALPGPEEESHNVGLIAKRRSELLSLIGVLRLADAFDFAHDRRIGSISLERRDGAVLLYAQGLEEISPSAERIARARYLLEATCGLPIIVRSLSAKGTASTPSARLRRRAAGAPG